jgi:hypothetical protein
VGTYWSDVGTLATAPTAPVIAALAPVTVGIARNNAEALLAFGGSNRAFAATPTAAVVTALKAGAIGDTGALTVRTVAGTGSLDISPISVAGI